MPTAQPFTNIIVVMLENRSYDNMLGWLYHAGNLPPYDQAPAGQTGLNGLTGSETNPCPYPNPHPTISVGNQTSTIVNGKPYPGTVIPGYDPGELFSDMAQQIFGSSAIPSADPYNATPPNDETMQGFTINYSQLGGPQVPHANIADVMNYFTPAQVPVTAFLANKFAVCDQWFASVPCQTFTNRVFAVCAAPPVHNAVPPYSLVNDKQYEFSNPVIGRFADLPSIFSALDKKFPESRTPNWKLYFHDYTIAMMTVPYVYAAGKSHANVNVATFDYSDWPQGVKPDPYHLFGLLELGAVPPTFLQDLASGNLPKLSFIEPRYSSRVAHFSNPPNSNHPGPYDDPVDVADGEAFLAQLYNALQANDACWKKNKTLLIVTYDEHGGTYDHVPPPAATPPGGSIPAAQDSSDPAANGFNFNRYGCRVPAIIVSPYIEPGSAIQVAPGSAPFDHSSIVKTVAENFGLASLTGRDAAAPSLLGYLQSSPVNGTGKYAGPVPRSAPRPRQTNDPVNGAALLHARYNQSARR